MAALLGALGGAGAGAAGGALGGAGAAGAAGGLDIGGALGSAVGGQMGDGKGAAIGGASAAGGSTEVSPYAMIDYQRGLSHDSPTDMMDYAMKSGLLSKLERKNTPGIRGLLDDEQMGLY